MTIERIETLRDYHPGGLERYVRDRQRSEALRGNLWAIDSGPPVDGLPVVAFVNALTISIVRARARWIAYCDLEYPAGPCRNAEALDLEDRRFMCTHCGNVAVGGRWRRIDFPERFEDGERVLLARESQHARQWLRPGCGHPQAPAEGGTLEDLIRENLEHGDPVPEDLEGLA